MRLCFTQYNMHKNKKQIQTAFITEIAKKNYEIITLQKFQQNTHMNITYCFNNYNF